MNNLFRFFRVCCVVALPCSALAQTPTSEAIPLLKTAFDNMNKSTSISTVEEVTLPKKSKAVVTTYKKSSPDGFRLTRREEAAQDTSPKPAWYYKQVVITNQDGIWELTGDHPKEILNLRFKVTQAKSLEKIYEGNVGLPPLSDKNEYKMEEVSYKNIPSYKITIKLDEEVYKVALEKMSQEIAATIAAQISEANSIAERGEPRMKVPPAEDKTPFVYEYIVSKDTKLIWSTKTYLRSGSLLQEQNLSRIEVGLPLADSLFEIPERIKKTVVQSFSQYLKIKLAHR